MEGMMSSIKANYIFATVLCVHFSGLAIVSSVSIMNVNRAETKDACAYHCILQHWFFFRPWLVDTNHPGAKLVVYDLTGGAEVVMWYAMLIRPGERFGSHKFACCCSFSW
jgi:hypothetical protein